MEQNTLKQNKQKAIRKSYIWLIAIAVIIGFLLSFHILPHHGMVFPKENLTFSNTFVLQKNVEELIRRFNNASILEQSRMKQEPLVRKLRERRIIWIGEENSPIADPGVVINGVRWATRNVDVSGTFVAFPESIGMFFQWNRRRGWTAKSRFVLGWDNSIPSGDTWTGANNPCPAGWRIPTQAELQRLRDAGSTWTVRNGVNGRLFGTAPNQIFLPAAGWRGNNRSIDNIGTSGNYWSSEYAHGLSFGRNGTSIGILFRPIGFSIRCVAEN